MRRGIVFLLVVLLGFGFVGCFSGQNNNDVTKEEVKTKAENKDDNVKNEEKVDSNSKEEDKKENHYPVTIKTSDGDLVIEKMPEKVMVFNYDIAEIMSALGLADKIMYFRGGHQSLDDILPQYKDALAGIKDTESIAADKGFPSLESMIALDPDIVIMPSYYFNVPAFGKKEDYKDNNINLYIMEGTYVSNCTIENTYNDILNIGKIFDREDKANDLILDIKNRVSEVSKKLEGKKPLRMLAYDLELNGKVVTWGGVGLANNILTLAGAENVFSDLDKQFPHVSYEELIDKDPDYIIIDVYGDDKSHGQDTINKLKENPETKDLRAVKEDRFITIPLFSIFPGLQNIETIEKISNIVIENQK